MSSSNPPDAGGAAPSHVTTIAYLSIAKIPSREANSIHVMKMCQAFARLGHQVTLVAPSIHVGVEQGVDDAFAFYGVDPGFRIARVRWRGIAGRGWFYGWEAGRAARRMGVQVAYGRSLRACAFAARRGVPTVFEAHAPDFLRAPADRRLFEWMIGSPSLRRVVTNCAALAAILLEAAPSLASRLLVAQNAADPIDDLADPADLGPPDGRVRVGYVGQLYPGKGFEIIRALASRVPEAAFHVVGGEPSTIDALRADPSVPGNVRLHGFAPPAAIERLTLAFDIVLAPYQRHVGTAGGGETAGWLSPMKVFGYMAAGRPIVCSDLPVVHEVLTDDWNALLVAPDDLDGWEAAVRRLMREPTTAARLADRARRDLLDRHTWQQRAVRVLDGIA